MILTKEITIKVASKNRAHYSETLKRSLDIGELITIPIDFLPTGTKMKVEVLCDYCNKNVSNVEYREYLKSVGNYSCSSCWKFKMEDISMSKYGVKNPFQSDTIKEKIKKTLKDRYGVSHPMELDSVKNKIKETCLERYGVTHHLKSDEIKDKQVKTNLERYGVTNVSKLNYIKSKVRETNIEKYGVDSYSKTFEFKDRFRKSSLKRFGVENPMMDSGIKEGIKISNVKKYGYTSYMSTSEFKSKSKESNLSKFGNKSHMKSESFRIDNFKISKDLNYIRYIKDNVSEFQCDLDYDHKFQISTSDYYNRTRSKIPICTICNPIGDCVSIKEKELYELIKNVYSGEIVQSYRDELEIDIYLPELNLGFEFNGLYWHSEENKNRNYHLNKTNHFKERGIRIIHIWEDDWSFKKEILKSQIKNWIGNSDRKIGARKCEVIEIKDSKLTRKFLDNNHIQGFVNSVVKLGLYYNGELVGMMTFDHSEGRKKMGDSEWNLSRFCNVLHTNVVGGASKLISFFVREYRPTRIVSYADKDWSTGQLYENIGFIKGHETNPDYKYIVGNKRIHKSRFRKNIVPESVKSSGYSKIFDSGKIKYEMYKIPM